MLAKLFFIILCLTITTADLMRCVSMCSNYRCPTAMCYSSLCYCYGCSNNNNPSPI